MIEVSVTLTALLAVAAAHPHHQQLIYPGYPGYPVQRSPSSFYYVPQADAASVSSVQRYAAPLPVGLAPGSPQYVLLYPGGPQHNFIHHRADENTPRPTIWNLFNYFQRPTTTPKSKDVTTEEAAEAVTTPPSPTTTPPLPTTRVTPAATTRATSRATTTTVATTVEETTPKPANEAPAKPEKIVGENEQIIMAVQQVGVDTADEENASLENLDENLPPNPESSGSPSDGRQYVLVQRPQFFGNYDLLHQGDMQQRFGSPPGADFLLFRNGFVKPALLPGQGQPGRPLKLEMEGDQVPGAAALAFQQALSDARRREYGDASLRAAHVPGSRHVDVSPVAQPQVFVNPRPQVGNPGLVSVPHALVPSQQVLTFQRQLVPPGFLHVGPAHQNVYVLPTKPAGTSHAVVVDADRPKKDGKGDTDEVEAEQAGPSVAQAKPQAIAIAGVGGMAAAAPVATAVVGPGGLAVAAPTATAVAGQSGGGSLAGSAQAALAAVHKQVNKGNKVKGKTNDQGYDYRDDDRYH